LESAIRKTANFIFPLDAAIVLVRLDAGAFDHVGVFLHFRAKERREFLARRGLRYEAELLVACFHLGLLQGRTELFQPRSDASDLGAEIDAVKGLLERALAAHARERAREGKHLAQDMRARARALGAIAGKLEARAKTLAPRLRDRLQTRLHGLLGKEGVELPRLAQEAAVLADRADVTEELVRLKSHLESLTALTNDTAPVGKRIDFLLQEVQRELNTVGSKSSDLDTTRLVLDGKAEVEKLREQVQNVE